MELGRDSHPRVQRSWLGMSHEANVFIVNADRELWRKRANLYGDREKALRREMRWETREGRVHEVAGGWRRSNDPYLQLKASSAIALSFINYETAPGPAGEALARSGSAVRRRCDGPE